MARTTLVEENFCRTRRNFDSSAADSNCVTQINEKKKPAYDFFSKQPAKLSLIICTRAANSFVNLDGSLTATIDDDGGGDDDGSGGGDASARFLIACAVADRPLARSPARLLARSPARARSTNAGRRNRLISERPLLRRPSRSGGCRQIFVTTAAAHRVQQR